MAQLKEEIISGSRPGLPAETLRVKPAAGEPVKRAAVAGRSLNPVPLLIGAVVSLAVALIGAAIWLAVKTPGNQHTEPLVTHRQPPAVKAQPLPAKTRAGTGVGSLTAPSPAPAASKESARQGESAGANLQPAPVRAAIPHVVPAARARTASTLKSANRPPAKARVTEAAEPEMVEPAHRSEPDQMGTWYRFSEGERGH